jgi:hypothetical protein
MFEGEANLPAFLNAEIFRLSSTLANVLGMI